MSELARPPLRVGVAVDTLDVPAWAASMLDRISEQAFAEIVIVIVAAPDEERSRDLPGLYHRLDRRIFATGEDPQATVELALTACPVTSLADAGAEHAIGAATPDVVLWLGTSTPAPEIPGVAADGVWWLDYGSEPPFVRVLATGSAVAETLLLTRTGQPDRFQVLGRIVTSADSISLRRVRDNAYWQVVELVLTSLQRRHEQGGGHHPLVTVGPRAESKALGAVGGAAIVTRAAARAARRRAHSLMFDEQWLVAYRPRPATDVLEGNTAGFTPLRPPVGRSYADPFLASHDGRRYLFFEDQPHGRPGTIARVEIRADGTPTEPQTVLSRDYHLSYPYVFRDHGEWLMIPDTAANRTIELYRAVDFPDRWELDRVLVDRISAVDTTPFEHEGRTWFFTSIGTPRGRLTDTMSLFWAESLTSTWNAHPGNPVVADTRHARPAGRIVVRDGRLLRPAQDGSVRYGYALVFNEIVELTPEVYSEVEVRRIEPDWLRGAMCTHHYDTDGELEVIDARVRVSRWHRAGRAARAERA